MKSIKIERNKIVLLGILVLGLFLRVYDLGAESLWLDEGFSIKLSSLPLTQIVEGTARDVHPPLYYLILKVWMSVFGNSEFSVRIPSVIFGFLSIFIMYQVGCMLFNENLGIVSALLVAVSSFHITYSQEARMYSLMALLALLSMCFFIRLVKKKTSADIIGYIISSTLLFYTHYYGAFILIVQNIYVLMQFTVTAKHNRITTKSWILLQFILFCTFLPWIKQLINQTIRIQSGFWIPTPSPGLISHSFVQYAGSTSMLAIYGMVICVSLIRYLGNRTARTTKAGYFANRVNVLLVLWLTIPIALPFIISHFSSSIFTIKSTIVASLAFYLIISKMIVSIEYRLLSKAVIVVIVTLSLISTWQYYNRIDKEQWREVASYIDTNAKTGDLLLFNAIFCKTDVFDYYSKRTDIAKRSLPANAEGFDKYDSTQLESIMHGYDRVWLILSHCTIDKELLKTKLLRSHRISYPTQYDISNEYVGIEVYLFEKKQIR